MGNNWYAVRWRILQRDSFTCQYCGQKAPDVILHVDHINPRNNGGAEDDSNLIVACSACNIGKNLSPFRPVVSSLAENPRPRLLSLLSDYLAEQGPLSATALSKALGRERSNISTILNGNPNLFHKTKGRGGEVFYSRKAL